MIKGKTEIGFANPGSVEDAEDTLSQLFTGLNEVGCDDGLGETVKEDMTSLDLQEPITLG